MAENGAPVIPASEMPPAAPAIVPEKEPEVIPELEPAAPPPPASPCLC